MPALKPTTYSGKIVYLGFVADREKNIASKSVDQMDLTFFGLALECHGGETRESCSRVTGQYPEGTIIRNTRQLCVVSAEDLRAIALEVGIPEVLPELMGASLVIEGLPDFTYIPPASRLQADGGTTLTVDMENRPCMFPGKEAVEPHHPGKGKFLMSAAKGRRGVTAWIECEGRLSVGDTIRLHIPDQRTWFPEAAE